MDDRDTILVRIGLICSESSDYHEANECVATRLLSDLELFS